MKRLFFAVLLFGTMFLLLIFPDAALQGAKTGLLLWFEQVLPSLLPFFILTKLLVLLGFHRALGKLFYPLFHPLFSLSPSGCFALVTGLLSGLPLGAKTVSELHAQNEISKREAILLLALCSNPSPMFLISYAAISQLKLTGSPYLVLLLVLASALLCHACCRVLPVGRSSSMQKDTNSYIATKKSTQIADTKNTEFSFALLDTCILSGFEAMSKIGGYIILFNIYAAVLPVLLPFPEHSLACLLPLCVLEMTTGITSACRLLPNADLSLLSVIGCCCFGGLSGLAQTKSVLSDDILSFGKLLLLKLCHCLIGIGLGFLYLQFN